MYEIVRCRTQLQNRASGIARATGSGGRQAALRGLPAEDRRSAFGNRGALDLQSSRDLWRQREGEWQYPAAVQTASRTNRSTSPPHPGPLPLGGGEGEEPGARI